MIVLAWIPFLQPLPFAWHDGVWPFLMLPLCIAVAVVYKSIKCEFMSQVPRQAAEITLWILFGMGSAAVALAGIVKSVEMWRS